jgi:hypothetical protein
VHYGALSVHCQVEGRERGPARAAAERTERPIWIASALIDIESAPAPNGGSGAPAPNLLVAFRDEAGRLRAAAHGSTSGQIPMAANRGVASTSRRADELESARGPGNDLLIIAAYAWPEEQDEAIETEARTPVHAA